MVVELQQHCTLRFEAYIISRRDMSRKVVVATMSYGKGMERLVIRIIGNDGV